MSRRRDEDIAFLKAFLRAAADPDGYEEPVVEYRGHNYDFTDQYTVDQAVESLMMALLSERPPMKVLTLARSAGVDVARCLSALFRLQRDGRASQVRPWVWSLTRPSSPARPDSRSDANGMVAALADAGIEATMTADGRVVIRALSPYFEAMVATQKRMDARAEAVQASELDECAYADGIFHLLVAVGLLPDGGSHETPQQQALHQWAIYAATDALYADEGSGETLDLWEEFEEIARRRRRLTRTRPAVHSETESA